MSHSQSSPISVADERDPEMQRAYEQARATFRYFWREVAWERRRIVPALDLAFVKAPFTEPQSSEAEYMWLGEVDFDGSLISGVLLNEPNWLKTVKAGDSVQMPLGSISDWMYAIEGEVYGAFTVNLLRSRMTPREREEHDNAWGLNFGDSQKIRLVPGTYLSPDAEHPMSEAMAPVLKDQLVQNPAIRDAKDEQGWTLLHDQALAGSAPTVRILLESGADSNAVTAQGQTPLQFAEALSWDKVAALLNSTRETESA